MPAPLFLIRYVLTTDLQQRCPSIMNTMDAECTQPAPVYLNAHAPVCTKQLLCAREHAKYIWMHQRIKWKYASPHSK